jgi:cytochrome P450
MNQPWLWNDVIYSYTNSGKEYKKCLDIIHGFTKRVIKERESELIENSFYSEKRKAFLDILLDAKNKDLKLTPSDIQEEVDTFMFEGHDTTTSATSWACQFIGSHSDVQKKLHSEIDKIFGIFNLI